MPTTPYDSAPDTLAHIDRVQHFIDMAVVNLDRRAERHDESKLLPPEKEVFDVMTPKLANLEYGSQEYIDSVRQLGPALTHHFEVNDHHPEHFGKGDPTAVSKMSAMALIEMICDWRAASERTKQRADGDEYLKRSFAEGLAYNQERFGYSDDVASIIRATALELGLIEDGS